MIDCKPGAWVTGLTSQNKNDSDLFGGQLLTKIKGIGNWTADVYLMHALQRTDLFPLGDVALVNSLREVKNLSAQVSKEEMLTIAEPWRPHRTIAAFILWHAYLSKRNVQCEI